jgi:hypothetical protein
VPRAWARALNFGATALCVCSHCCLIQLDGSSFGKNEAAYLGSSSRALRDTEASVNTEAWRAAARALARHFLFVVNVNRARVRNRKTTRQHKSERRAADPRPCARRICHKSSFANVYVLVMLLSHMFVFCCCLQSALEKQIPSSKM